MRADADGWQARYQAGGDSGAGSRGANAARKAGYVNAAVIRHNIGSLVDWGCGDGTVAALIEVERYIGVDIAPAAVTRCIERRKARGAFVVWRDDHNIGVVADAAVSLDVAFHFPQDDGGYRVYLRRVFQSATRLVVVHSTDHDDNARSAGHVQHRRVARDVGVFFPHWQLASRDDGVNGGVFLTYTPRP